MTTAFQIFHLPKSVPLNAGVIMPGAKASFFLTETSTPTPVYTDPELQIAHTQPVVADAAGILPTIYLDPAITYKVTLTTAADVLYYTIDPANDQPFSQAAIGAALYPQTAAELSASLTPVNYAVASHEFSNGLVYPSRYFNNTTPGTTDCTLILNTLADFCRDNGFTLALEPETWLISGSLDFSEMTVIGQTAIGIQHLQASSAQFHCITSTGNSVFRDFRVDGGWDGSTAGQDGDILHFVGSTFAYVITLDNLVLTNAKKRHIYWVGAGYSIITRVRALVAGLHSLEFDGSTYVCSSVQVDGMSQFGGCPNGYGIKLNNCASMTFDSLIIEDTLGISTSGSNNRSLSFNEVYQENFTVVSTNFFDGGGAGIGLSITNCYGGGKIIGSVASWENVYFSGNSNLTEPAIPLAGRVIQQNGGENTTSTTGGVEFTAVTVSLPPGTWQLTATMQILDAGVSVMVRAGIRITTNASDSGLAVNTNSSFVEGADEATSFGANQDARLRAYTIIQNNTTASLSVYLRGYLNLSSGTMAYKGYVTAVKM